jgi:hypothetical protein
MSGEQLIPALFAMTIGAVLLFAVWQLVVFLRNRRNRQIMKDVIND